MFASTVIPRPRPDERRDSFTMIPGDRSRLLRAKRMPWFSFFSLGGRMTHVENHWLVNDDKLKKIIMDQSENKNISPLAKRNLRLRLR